MKKVFILLSIVFVSSLAQAEIAISKKYVSFYNVEVGNTEYETVYLSNSGEEDLKAIVSDTCGSEYFVTDTCFKLSPGQSCWINVRFRPYTSGSRSCTIWIRSDLGDYENIYVNGHGIEN